jgi:hypothetical protein
MLRPAGKLLWCSLWAAYAETQRVSVRSSVKGRFSTLLRTFLPLVCLRLWTSFRLLAAPNTRAALAGRAAELSS